MHAPAIDGCQIVGCISGRAKAADVLVDEVPAGVIVEAITDAEENIESQFAEPEPVMRLVEAITPVEEL